VTRKCAKRDIFRATSPEFASSDKNSAVLIPAPFSGLAILPNLELLISPGLGAEIATSLIPETILCQTLVIFWESRRFGQNALVGKRDVCVTVSAT
jgi:hypothetical protein